MSDAWQRLSSRRRRAITEQLLSERGYVCFICGLRIATRAEVSVQHIKPQSLGGGNEFSNLAPAHLKCNIAAGNNEMKNYVMRRYSAPPFFRAR